MKVEFYRHSLGEDEIREVTDTLRSLFLTTAGKTARFEAAFAEFLGVPHAVGVTSCTAALHLSLVALGIGPGDEVIVPAMTFIATINPVWWVGATPVLADVDPVTGLLDPSEVEARITPRTRAVIPVHLYGAMADMRRLRALADRHGFALIEDSAHCVEGERDGVRPGQLGDIACFSFYATKNLTCGEGGAVATTRADLADRVRTLRLHGMSKGAADRYHARTYVHWDMVALGYKYNLSDIQAALLLPQLPKLRTNLERREAICGRYEQAFGAMPAVDFPRVPAGCRSARHLFTIWVPEPRRDALLQYLGEHGIGCAVNYRAVHTLTYFRERLRHPPDAFPNALSIGRRTVTLPLYPGLRDDEVEAVIETVREGLG